MEAPSVGEPRHLVRESEDSTDWPMAPREGAGRSSPSAARGRRSRSRRSHVRAPALPQPGRDVISRAPAAAPHTRPRWAAAAAAQAPSPRPDPRAPVFGMPRPAAAARRCTGPGWPRQQRCSSPPAASPAGLRPGAAHGRGRGCLGREGRGSPPQSPCLVAVC